MLQYQVNRSASKVAQIPNRMRRCVLNVAIGVTTLFYVLLIRRQFVGFRRVAALATLVKAARPTVFNVRL